MNIFVKWSWKTGDRWANQFPDSALEEQLGWAHCKSKEGCNLGLVEPTQTFLEAATRLRRPSQPLQDSWVRGLVHATAALAQRNKSGRHLAPHRISNFDSLKVLSILTKKRVGDYQHLYPNSLSNLTTYGRGSFISATFFFKHAIVKDTRLSLINIKNNRIP